MFSKAKKDNTPNGNNNRPTTQSRPDPRAKQTSQPTASQNKSPVKRANNMKSPGVPSIISTDVILEGNLISTGEVQFDGNLTGNIKAASLIIGEKASVTGEVACEAVTIRGRVEGMVRARNVALAATAYIQGDIMHSSLSVEPGAHFDGNCRHSEDPLADDAANAFDRPSGQAPTSGTLSQEAPRPSPSAHTNNSQAAFAAPTTNQNSNHSNNARPASAINELGNQITNPNEGASSFLAKNRSPLR